MTPAASISRGVEEAGQQVEQQEKQVYKRQSSKWSSRRRFTRGRAVGGAAAAGVEEAGQQVEQKQV